MNRESLLKLYDRLTSLVEKLPGGLQKPILKELGPLRELFLEQRPPRICLLGGGLSVTAPALLHQWCGTPVETGETRFGWREYRVANLGAAQILDARAETPQQLFETAIASAKPDALIFVRGDEGDSLQSAFETAAQRAAACDDTDERHPPMIALACGDIDPHEAPGRLRALLSVRKEFVQRNLHVFSGDGEIARKVVEAICDALPHQAQLEFARVTNAREAQAKIASSLLKSFTAVCGVIGLQPIPLADMPVLTTVQTMMVGLVVYVSGRTASARLVAEFVGALGINIGAGFALREGARALLKAFPVWGNAISGFVAGAGTYAIGRSAIAYFIEEAPIHETRKLFRKLSPGISAFAKKRLPRLTRKP